MDFESYLAAAGYDAAKLTPEQKSGLELAWKFSQRNGAGSGGGGGGPGQGPKKSIQQEIEETRRENERRAEIEGMIRAELADRDLPRHMIDRLQEIAEQAIEGGWDRQKTELAIVKAGRASARSTHAPEERMPESEVLEAAFCVSGGLTTPEKFYSPRVLEAAQKRFKGGLGLAELVLHHARRNGYRGYNVKDTAAVLEAAWKPDVQIRADGVPSTYSLPNTLANIAHKFVRVGWDGVDSTYARISATRSVSDFKTNTTVSLTGGNLYNKLAPNGEIKHGGLGELTYTNKVDTYAKMLGIGRPDLINDDAGVLTTASRRLGRGAKLKVNDIFWTVFLNNSSFFAAGNNNVSTGAGSALAIAGVNAAYSVFQKQTDPDGFPLAVMPAILLVPPTLYPTGLTIANSTTVVGSTSQPGTNIWAGKFRIESSPYMENTAYTGNSSAAWYLLADPNDVPVIEVAYLNGQQEPTVETAQLDFNMLGISMRGFIDFGVALQEYRGGVRSAGS